jgi:serine acetyltransferase
LEYYIYHSGYGPTNETLGKFIRSLFGQEVPAAAAIEDGHGKTIILEETARVRDHTTHL